MPFLQTLGGGSAQGFRAGSGSSSDEWVDGSGGTETTSGCLLYTSDAADE